MVAECRPYSVTTIKDGAVSIIFHVASELAADLMHDVHPYLLKPVRLEIHAIEVD